MSKRTLIMADGSEMDVDCGPVKCGGCGWQTPIDAVTIRCCLFGKNHRFGLLGKRSNDCLDAERKSLAGEGSK